MNNSVHLVSTIRSETILDNEIMVSFNVESLFTNIPIDAAVEAALKKLENEPSLAVWTTLTAAQIVDLLNFVLRSTNFQYNGSMYKQREGAAMGSPVSAVLRVRMFLVVGIVRSLIRTQGCRNNNEDIYSTRTQ